MSGDNDEKMAKYILYLWKLSNTHQIIHMSRGNHNRNYKSISLPFFVAATQGTLLYWLPLVASGACFRGSHGTVTNKETVLGRLPTPGHSAEIAD